VHVLQSFNGSEIDIATIDEWLYLAQQLPAQCQVARNGTCLDQGVAFPVPAFALVVLVQGRETGAQRPGITEGT
jgi:hypothetical protein